MEQCIASQLPLELSYTISKPFFTNPEQAYAELPPYIEHDPQNFGLNRSIRIHVEAILLKQQHLRSIQPFQKVEFRLYGAIKSQVQRKVAVQKILHSSITRTWSDFQRHQRGKRSQTHNNGGQYHCDLTFPIENSLQSSSRYKKAQLLPSIDLRASKYVTQSTALNDQHLVSGRCQVIYCIEALVTLNNGECQSATTRLDNHNQSSLLGGGSIVNLQPIPRAVRLVTPRKLLKGENASFDAEAKAKESGILRMKKQCHTLLSAQSLRTQSRPRILFSVGQVLDQDNMVIASSVSSSSFTIPVTLTVSLPTTPTRASADFDVGALRQHLIESGLSNTITVTSTWHTKYTFTTNTDSDPCPESTIDNHTVRQDTRVMKFPPCYEISERQFTATAQLDIPLLAGLPATSSDGLLKIQHFLSFVFVVGESEKPIAPDSLNAKTISLAGMVTRDIRFECVVDV